MPNQMPSPTSRRAAKAAPVVFVLAFGLWSLLACAQATDDRDISVTVKVSADLITVDTSTRVAATPAVVWDVLTDFDHMTEISSNLSASRVVSRSSNKWVVAQAGYAAWGPFSFAFDTVRELELKPITEIRSHLISGTLKKQDGTTRVIVEGNGTRLTTHSEFITDSWIPPVVGVKFIETESRKQIAELRNEILRRNARASAPAASPPGQASGDAARSTGASPPAAK